MVDSDDDYVEAPSSGDEYGGPSTRRTRGTSSRTKSAGASARTHPSAPPNKERWEEIHRSWDVVTESADGSITSAVLNLLESTRRHRRILRDSTPLQRGIIRHMILVIDLSLEMAEKDFRPNRYLVTLRYAVEFIREFFEQNPISQLGVLGMRDGVCEVVSEVGGNVVEHVARVRALRNSEPRGAPSLQNALDMARAALFHAPAHGTREVLIIFSALHSSDPGDIHQTISALASSHVVCRVVGLAAQVAVCRELVRRTNPAYPASDPTAYGVAMHEQHFRELLMEATIPPVTHDPKSSVASLLMMGFPSRVGAAGESLPDASGSAGAGGTGGRGIGRASFCACHGKPVKGGYNCSRCTTKVCSLPTECPTCGLTLILSTHLARSYHHLFPLPNWVEVPWKFAHKSTHCFGCQTPFPPVPLNIDNPGGSKPAAGTSISSRYACPKCRKHFCVDCDIFTHEHLHNCPGCLSTLKEESEKRTGGAHKSTEQPADSMVID